MSRLGVTHTRAVDRSRCSTVVKNVLCIAVANSVGVSEISTVKAVAATGVTLSSAHVIPYAPGEPRACASGNRVPSNTTSRYHPRMQDANATQT